MKDGKLPAGYGWNYGTAELGNNATHELDIARWALQVSFPTRVDVDAGKTAFVLLMQLLVSLPLSLVT